MFEPDGPLDIQIRLSAGDSHLGWTLTDQSMRVLQGLP